MGAEESDIAPPLRSLRFEADTKIGTEVSESGYRALGELSRGDGSKIVKKS